MSPLPKVLHKEVFEDGTEGYLFECPGCNHTLHVITTKWGEKSKTPLEHRHTWKFVNGNMDKPTFQPSLVMRISYTDKHRPDLVCHSFVKDGMIQYLPDCTHLLAGQTVPLPELDFD